MTDLTCDIMELYNNISKTCTTDMEIAEDDCSIFCMMALMKGLDICSDFLYRTSLLKSMKEIINYCVTNISH